tara:strand:- start:984 stop:1856 length:873 start_codon:yes stop_codon:yes gene_type:complete
MEIKNKAIIFILASLFSCTSNPFWDDSSIIEMKITGRALTDNNQTNVPVSVWLETFDLYTTTDSIGYFSFSITNSQTPTGNINGPINLYFYIHNYELDSVTVYFTNGMFAKDQTDFSDDGRLLNPVEMKKLLSGEVKLHFNKNSIQIRDTLRISFNFETHSALSIDTYKYILDEDSSDFHSGIFFRSLTDNKVVTIYRFTGKDQFGNSVEDQLQYLTYEENEFITWTYYLLSDSLNLSSGDYEVLPYLLIRHDQIPTGLIEAQGGDSVLTLSAYYLDLPLDILSDTLQIN